MVESVTPYGYEIKLFKKEEQWKPLALEMDNLRLAKIRITKKPQTPPIGTKYKQNNQLQTEFKKGN